ncbi:MAG: nicotinic acid mononucleotide adenylyltransferase [Alkaliphilus sp.]|nr:nicotinate-nucleotide adenylyltransferase [bacterium AH-315-E09]PHS35143.1 MAG: nicotinic acid mononucleotide adenylyltransferase [Alkaliphilus sp.]
MATKQNGKFKVARYGVLGGTFDPIHNAHLHVAVVALEELNLDKIIFIPSGIPPHKAKHEVTRADHRLMMTTLAINGNDNFFVSETEVNRAGESYTIQTMRELRDENFSAAEFYFIVGADAFTQIETWAMYEDLLKITKFVVVTRTGSDNKTLDETIEKYKNNFGADIYKISIPNLEISSTDIRSRIKRGKNVEYLIPAVVVEYIRKYNIYKN